MSREEFWDSTPRELWRDFEVATRRARDLRDEATTLAWMMAVLQRSERVPRLETLLLGSQAKRQSVVDHKRTLEQLSAQYGIPLKRRH